MNGKTVRALCAGGLIAMISGQLEAQDLGLTVFLKGSLTTSAEIFPYSHAIDPVLRAESHAISDAFGGGVEVKYTIPDANLAIGLSSEYLHVTNSSQLLHPLPVMLEEGYAVVPVELTGYFLIPFSGQSVVVFMGAGVGAYFGSRIYRIGGMDAPAVSTSPGVGIHVLSGVTVQLFGPVLIAGEMKFRDVQFTSTNQFPSSTVSSGGIIVHVPADRFDSSIHTDGVIFQIGLGVAF